MIIRTREEANAELKALIECVTDEWNRLRDDATAILEKSRMYRKRGLIGPQEAEEMTRPVDAIHDRMDELKKILKLCKSGQVNTAKNAYVNLTTR